MSLYKYWFVFEHNSEAHANHTIRKSIWSLDFTEWWSHQITVFTHDSPSPYYPLWLNLVGQSCGEHDTNRDKERERERRTDKKRFKQNGGTKLSEGAADLSALISANRSTVADVAVAAVRSSESERTLDQFIKGFWVCVSWCSVRRLAWLKQSSNRTSSYKYSQVCYTKCTLKPYTTYARNLWAFRFVIVADTIVPVAVCCGRRFYTNTRYEVCIFIRQVFWLLLGASRVWIINIYIFYMYLHIQIAARQLCRVFYRKGGWRFFAII